MFSCLQSKSPGVWPLGHMVGVGWTYKKRPFVYQPLRDPVPGLLGQSSLRCVPRSVVIRLQDMPWMLLNYSQSGDIIITHQRVVKAPFLWPLSTFGVLMAAALNWWVNLGSTTGCTHPCTWLAFKCFSILLYNFLQRSYPCLLDVILLPL